MSKFIELTWLSSTSKKIFINIDDISSIETFVEKDKNALIILRVLEDNNPKSYLVKESMADLKKMLSI